jgi:DNA-binding transcriptional LysR family regulator
MSSSNKSDGSEKLDSDLLRSFLAIAEAGSFSRGAERIHRSQSAVSLQIKRLEGLLGQAVFVRHARGIALTSTGEKLRPLAQQVVSLLDGAIGNLRSQALAGSLRIGIPDEYGETLLPQFVAGFSREHPQVEISVTCGFSADFPRALAGNELDLAVHAVETAPRRARILRTERMIWVGSRLHAVHEQDPLPLALFDRACWWRDRVLETLESAGRAYKVVFTSESVAGVAAAIEAGVAVGVLGEASLRGNLQPLPKGAGLPRMPNSLLILDGRLDETPAARAMTATIIEAFARVST